MLKMRLQRVGRKHEPSFRIVLTDSKNSTKSGRFKEILGSYDPRKSTDLLKKDRIEYWLAKGAKLTGTVHNLFVTHGVVTGKKINVLPKKTPIVKEVVAESVAPVAPVAETPTEVSAADEPTAPIAETPAEEVVPETLVEEVAPEAQAEVATPVESESTEAPVENIETSVETETPPTSEPAAPEEPKAE